MSDCWYWYDSHHTGCVRKMDMNTKKIYGSDPNEFNWVVPFRFLENNLIEIDFKSKRTHHGKRILTAKLQERNMKLRWSDGNTWYRIKHKGFLKDSA